MKRINAITRSRDRAPYKEGESVMQRVKEYASKSSFCCIRGKKCLEICGCCGLITYKDEEIEIRLCDGFIRICGNDLGIRHYFGGRMVISGSISMISFTECCYSKKAI